jgi:hypothetical protein
MKGKPKQIDYAVVRQIAMAMPDVEEVTARGVSGLKAAGRLMAWPAVHKSAEPNTLAVRLDLVRRDELIAEEPSVYYVTEHYLNYPTVLVRLSQINRTALEDLLTMAWRQATSRRR